MRNPVRSSTTSSVRSSMPALTRRLTRALLHVVAVVSIALPSTARALEDPLQRKRGGLVECAGVEIFSNVQEFICTVDLQSQDLFLEDPVPVTVAEAISLMAGGSGCEWYFGYQYDHNDLNLEDFTARVNSDLVGKVVQMPGNVCFVGQPVGVTLSRLDGARELDLDDRDAHGRHGLGVTRVEDALLDAAAHDAGEAFDAVAPQLASLALRGGPQSPRDALP